MFIPFLFRIWVYSFHFCLSFLEFHWHPLAYKFNVITTFWVQITFGRLSWVSCECFHFNMFADIVVILLHVSSNRALKQSFFSLLGNFHSLFWLPVYFLLFFKFWQSLFTFIFNNFFTLIPQLFWFRSSGSSLHSDPWYSLEYGGYVVKIILWKPFVFFIHKIALAYFF